LTQLVVELTSKHPSFFLDARLDFTRKCTLVGELPSCALRLLTDARGFLHCGRHAVEAFPDLSRLSARQKRQPSIERAVLDAGKRLGDALEWSDSTTCKPENRDVGHNQKDTTDQRESRQIVPGIENRAGSVRRHAQRRPLKRNRQRLRRAE